MKKLLILVSICVLFSSCSTTLYAYDGKPVCSTINGQVYWHKTPAKK